MKPLHCFKLAPVVGIVACFFLAACSFNLEVGGSSSVQDLAEEAVTDELNDLELNTDDVSCNEPSDESVGTVFLCTSGTEVGAIEWEASISSDDSVRVRSTNLVVADRLPLLEEAATMEISQSLGQTVPPENMDCGDQHVVTVNDEVDCELLDTVSDSVFGATLTITDYDEGTFRIVVSEQPIR